MSPVESTDVQGVVAHLAEWLRRPDNQEIMWEEPRRKIEAYLRGDSVHPGIVASRLRQLSTWHSVSWAVGTFAGDPAAGAHIQQVALCDALNVRIVSGLYEADTRRKKAPRLSFNDTALSLANALVVGRDPEAEAIGEHLLRGVSEGLFYGIGETRVAPFVMSLYSEYKSLPAPAEQQYAPMPEAYRDILAAWRSPDAADLEGPLTAACDFHLSRSGEHTDEDTFEFAEEVYRIYPVEILLVFKLRERARLPNPQLDHRLLNTPLGTLPEIQGPPHDALLDELEAKFLTD